MNEQDTTQVRSVAKAMELLERLLERRAPMTLQELSTASGYPKSTVHALLSTMRAYSVISQGADGRYALGLRLFECGCAVSESWDVSRLAHPYLEELSARTGASSFIAFLNGNEVTSFDRCAGGAGLQVVPELGSRLPLHATSQGKLLLSAMGEGEVLRRVQKSGLRAYTPHTVIESGKLLDTLEEVRRNGYAVEDGEYKIGLRSVSAPVYDSGGALRYALGVVGLFRNLRSEEFRGAVRHTVACAARLSSALGYVG